MSEQFPTLSEMLAKHGFTHHKAWNVETTGRHDIFDKTGRKVACLTAHEAWPWLAKQIEQ